MSTIQRVTGMNSGLDVDSLVKAGMQSYQTNIDKETQNEKVLEYQQEQYRQIMSDASDFYDKYFDVLKTGNIMSSSTYQTETFKSDDESKVTARGLAGAAIDNYTVNVTQLAAKASDTLSSSETGTKTITIGTSTITFESVSDGDITVANYNKAIADRKAALNAIVSPTDAQKKELSDLNNNVVTAKYSQFSGNVVFTASSFGQGGFTISGHDKAQDKYLEATVRNSSGQVYTISDADKKTSNSVTVDNVVFDFKGVSTSTSTTVASPLSALTQVPDDPTFSPLTELAPLADAVGTTTTEADGTEVTTGSDGTVTKKTTAADGTVTTVTTSADKSATTTTVISPDKSTTVTTTKGAVTTVTDANGVITTTDTSHLDTANKTGYTLKTIKVGSTGVTTTTTKTNYDGTTPITKTIEKSGTTTTTTTTLKDGDKTTFKQEIDDGTNTSITATTEQRTSDGSITTVENSTKDDASGTTTLTSSVTTQLKMGADGTTKTVTTTKGGTTTTTATTYGTPTSLTGGSDVKNLKDTIVNFINDYNKLLSEINTKLYEKRDKDYMPLTDDQKKQMTDSQITAWEKKAQTGLLRKDDDLERIAEEMKSAMSTVMSGSGLSLEKIGIAPVKNYTDKNGMLIVDEDKLTTALEENGGDVKDLFTRIASGTDQGGALTRLKSALYSEFKTSSSSLSKKAGLEGSSTETDNTISKSISDKKKLLVQLNQQFTDKENALYNKYSQLETAMEQLNSQKSSLASMLGQS